jgi:hypothetical protein
METSLNRKGLHLENRLEDATKRLERSEQERRILIRKVHEALNQEDYEFKKKRF